MKHKRVIPVYKELLVSGINEKTIGPVIKVLVKLDGKKSGSSLVPMLKSVEADTRSLVAKSLAKIKYRAALPDLEKALKVEKDKSVKKVLKEVIKKLSA